MRTTTLSASEAPSGASGAGRFGRRRRASRSWLSVLEPSRSTAASSLPSCRLSSRSSSALAVSPALMASPTCFERTFTRPLTSSASRARRRCSTSSVATRSTSEPGTPLRARAALVASRSTRRRRTSITCSKLTGGRTATRGAGGAGYLTHRARLTPQRARSGPGGAGFRGASVCLGVFRAGSRQESRRKSKTAPKERACVAE